VLTGASLAVSARVLVCSDFTRREVVHRFPEIAARVLHIPLGPDDDLERPPLRAEARARLGVAGPLLLAVGSLFNRRRVPELLQAVARLAPGFPALRLHVVGDNRTHPRRDFAALAARLGIGGRVRFEGFLGEAALADLYAAADLALCLSDYEGFGLPALEAMSRGVPVLASDRPSLNEIFGEAAQLVDPGDPAAIAHEIGRLLRDTALRNEITARGLRLAARYSWRVTAERTRAALEDAATHR
jgi:glycosyltransferase involved in cell wall biosynthesis